jgi:hypothetical protein
MPKFHQVCGFLGNVGVEGGMIKKWGNDGITPKHN